MGTQKLKKVPMGTGSPKWGPMWAQWCCVCGYLKGTFHGLAPVGISFIPRQFHLLLLQSCGLKDLGLIFGWIRSRCARVRGRSCEGHVIRNVTQVKPDWESVQNFETLI